MYFGAELEIGLMGVDSCLRTGMNPYIRWIETYNFHFKRVIS
jgi:hypothetical protein